MPFFSFKKSSNYKLDEMSYNFFSYNLQLFNRLFYCSHTNFFFSQNLNIGIKNIIENCKNTRPTDPIM